jgi:hypothetical protein
MKGLKFIFVQLFDYDLNLPCRPPKLKNYCSHPNELTIISFISLSKYPQLYSKNSCSPAFIGLVDLALYTALLFLSSFNGVIQVKFGVSE